MTLVKDLKKKKAIIKFDVKKVSFLYFNGCVWFAKQ